MFFPARVPPVPPRPALFNPRTPVLAALEDSQEGLLRTADGALFLGHVYPFALLTPLFETAPPLRQVSTAQLLQGLDQPDPVRLMTLVKAGRVGFRAMYMYLHWVITSQNASGIYSSEFVAATLTEFMRWAISDGKWLTRRIYRRVEPRLDRPADPEAHWRFQSFLDLHKRRPDVAWHGHVDVPVHRLLWPRFRQSEPLRPEDRLRKRDVCPDEYYRDCVNPHHFEYTTPMTDLRPIWPGQQNKVSSGYTRYRFDWNAANVWDDTFQGVLDKWVHCPEGHLMPDGVQQFYRRQVAEGPWHDDNPSGKQARCALCYERYRQEVGVRPDGHTLNRRSRGMPKPNATRRQIREDEAIAAMLEQSIAEGRFTTQEKATGHAPPEDIEYDIFGMPMEPRNPDR